MGFASWLRQLFGGLSRSSRTSPDRDRETDRTVDRADDPAPSRTGRRSFQREWTDTSFDAPEVNIAVYSKSELVDRNGRAPEVMAGRYLGNAIEDLGLNYRIKRGYDAVDIEGGDGALGRWADYDRPWTAKDANVLLTAQPGGGLSFVGGQFGLAPAGHIDEVVPWRRSGDSLIQRNVHAILHEVGHMLGARHDHDETQTGMQHPGKGWNEAGYWHRTPTVAGNGYPNLCGEAIETRAHDQVMRHQLYNDCLRDQIEIADSPDDELT